MRSLPTSLLIEGVPWKVKVFKTMRGAIRAYNRIPRMGGFKEVPMDPAKETLWGFYNPDECMFGIYCKNRPLEDKFQTLLHEVNHYIFYEYNKFCGRMNEEKFVDFIAARYTEILFVNKLNFG